MGTGAFILAALKALPELIALINAIMRAADQRTQRGIGYDQAVKDSLVEGARRVTAADEAEEAARKDHAAHPSDDDGFDREFERKS